MKALFLCGVDEAGKSMTLRYSVQHLNTCARTKSDFLNKRNPSKVVVVNGKKVYIALCSPQELWDAERSAVDILKERLDSAKRNNVDLFILPLNIDKKYDQSIDECLNYLVTEGLKSVSSFVYLDSKLSRDIFARQKINQIQSNQFTLLGIIERMRGPKIREYNRRGRLFANYINGLLGI